MTTFLANLSLFFLLTKFPNYSKRYNQIIEGDTPISPKIGTPGVSNELLISKNVY